MLPAIIYGSSKIIRHIILYTIYSTRLLVRLHNRIYISLGNMFYTQCAIRIISPPRSMSMGRAHNRVQQPEMVSHVNKSNNIAEAAICVQNTAAMLFSAQIIMSQFRNIHCSRTGPKLEKTNKTATHHIFNISSWLQYLIAYPIWEFLAWLICRCCVCGKPCLFAVKERDISS